MSDFVLSCCSTADMPLEHFQKKNIPFVCFHFNMEGRNIPMIWDRLLVHGAAFELQI